MKYRFRANEKAIITKYREKKSQDEIKRGIIPNVQLTDYLPRRKRQSVFMMPFYVYSQSTGGFIADAHTYSPPVLPSFPTQHRLYQDGDIMLLLVETSLSQTVPTPSGWELCPNLPVTSGDTKMTMFWKRVTQLETAVIVPDTGEHQIDRLFVVRGCIETGNPFDVSDTNTGTGVTITFPSVISTTDKGMAILATTFDHNASVDQLTDGVNSTFSYIYKETGFALEESGVGGGLGFFSAGMPNKGATGTTTTNQNTSTNWTAYTAILKPAINKKPYLLNASLFPASPFRAMENDIILAMAETNNESVAVNSPLGYEEVLGSPVVNAGTNPTRLTMFWKRAGTSETFPTFVGHSDHIRVWVVIFRGCIKTGNPFDENFSTNIGNGTSVSAGGIYTTVKNAFVFTVVATTRDAFSSFNTFNTWNNSDLENLTPHIDNTVGLGTGGGLAMAGGYKTSAGTVLTTTAHQSVSVEWAAWQGALKPET